MLILDLPGPQFLLLFWLLLIASLGIAHVWSQLEFGVADELDARRALVKDPYRFACLRGGRREVACLAMFWALDQGWVEVRGDRWQITAAGEAATPACELEQLSLQLARPSIVSVSYLERLTLSPPVSRYMRDLTGNGLVHDPKSTRKTPMQRVIIVFVILALCKFAYALAHGHHNVFFLLGIILFLLLIYGTHGPSAADGATRRGRDLIRERQNMMSGLRKKYPKVLRQHTDEALNLVGIFGFDVLPREAYPERLWLLPPLAVTGRASIDGSGCSASSCGGGSSCSSCSSGASCGSGCGGCGGGGD